MKYPSRVLAIVGILTLGPARAALACVPGTELNDLARMRIQTISFFLMCFLLSAWGVQRIWNAARRDFPRLPHLSYARANGLVFLWGLLFVLILTMLAGARELMTPGAWKKQGFTYKLAEDAPVVDPAAARQEMQRRHGLDRLRAALWTYARHHEGRFPPNANPPEIPEDVWHVPDPSGMRYLYNPGLIADRGAEPLAYEPGISGAHRLALFTNGEMAWITDAHLQTPMARRRSP